MAVIIHLTLAIRCGRFSHSMWVSVHKLKPEKDAKLCFFNILHEFVTLNEAKYVPSGRAEACAGKRDTVAFPRPVMDTDSILQQNH